jgi:biopolymer transport protein ExbD
MKPRHIPDSHSTHPNVTPLIDVVMCLIVFFMLVAKIGVNTGAEEMVIPATIQGLEIQDHGNTLTLNVFPGITEDEPRITALVGGGMTELRTRDAQGRNPLAESLKLLRFGPTLKPGGPGDNPNFGVVIRGEEGLQYRYLEPVLMAAAEARVNNVSFNTRKVVVTVRQ